MESVDIVNKVLKISYINIVIYFVFLKIIGYESNKRLKNILAVISGLLLSVIEVVAAQFFWTFPVLVLVYVAYGILIAIITQNKIMYSITIIFIALTITYSGYIISIALAGILTAVFRVKMTQSNPIILITIISIETFIMWNIFRIKRFKNGIGFLKDKNKVYNIGVFGSMTVGMTLIAYSLFGNIEGNKLVDLLFAGIVLETVCLFIWLKRKITVYYRQRLKERTVEELESEIRARDERICEVVDENSRLAEVNHKFSSRIRALEDFSCKMIERPEIAELMRCEFGNEFADFEEAVKNVSEEFSSEMKHAVIIRKNLPKTGVFGVDNLLEYMCKESAKNGIDFDVKINGNILFMVQKIIDSKMLETLLGDHIKDAIIAINSSQNTYKNILVTIGIVKECYEISIYDTGIEFEIDTLLKLGLERITTHKSTGGSGIGFMTTFETLAKTKASLIIEEKHPITNNDYTKIVRIRFDGKKEYRIKSYRQNEIEGRKVDKRIKFEKT